MGHQHLATYDDAKEWLYGLKNRGTTYGIERMQRLAARLGHPERSYPVVHVAGTNGKGSTCAMLDAMFRAHGFRTGLSTSPHLVRQGERIQVNREILGEERILQYVRELAELGETVEREEPGMHPSFFEFMTAMAFVHFRNQKVDVALVEVGLGGRLDATNVVDPELSIITSIAMDHCEILGDTLDKIAREKAGIIKPGKPVVIGVLPEEAERAIREVAAERGCAIHSARERWGNDPARYPATNLVGGYQRLNAAVALLAAEVLQERFELDLEKCERSLMAVAWAGRWERMRMRHREVVFDVSHNVEGAEWLDRNLEALVAETGRAPDVVMGVMGQYRARALVPVVCRWARSIIFVMPQQNRSCRFEELEACLPEGFRGEVSRGEIAQLFPAQGECSLDFETPHPLVVTGSIYLIGEVWERYREPSPVNQGKLQDF